jgi:hypothetical protein
MKGMVGKYQKWTSRVVILRVNMSCTRSWELEVSLIFLLPVGSRRSFSSFPRPQRLIFSHLLAFGAVYAARTRGNVRDGKRLYVAAKFTPITAAKKQAGGIIRHDEFGLIFNEVLALALLRDNPGVPALHAVYAHGCTLITVMELFGAWPVEDDLGALPELNFDTISNTADLVQLRPCDGLELLAPHRYIPRFRRPGEMDVCKMSSIHLSTLQQMKERGCSHEDIAHRNVVINENYDVYSHSSS